MKPAKKRRMGSTGRWMRFWGVAAAYGVTFLLLRRADPGIATSPWFVVAAMICFLGLMSVAKGVVRIRMPRALRGIRDWEARGRAYRALGVAAFGALLRRTPLRLLNRDVYLARRTRHSGELSAQLEAAEASHFWAAFLVVPYMVRLVLAGTWGALFWVTVAQVLANLYPIMHLRMARHRLERLSARAARTPVSRP